MQTKALFITLLATLATALPSPAESNEAQEVTQGNAFSGTTTAGEIGILATKNWQAAGGCKRDWDEDNRCLSQCIGEANTKCIGWKHMTAVLQGGCVISWNTCRCVCEY